MNGATLLSATVVTHNKVIINDNKLINESNDDETESESDDDYYNEICDENSNLSLAKNSSRDKSSEQKNSNRKNSLERGNSIRLRSNRKSKCSEPNNKLDSVRFSMYAIQNSQLNEIDALLSELNQLQNTLDYSSKIDTNMKPKPSSPIKNTSLKGKANSNNHLDEIEAIDQQFDEVLKFLAESINEQTANQSSSAASSPNHNQPKNDRSSGSSNSSGIGDDFESPTSTAVKISNNQENKNQLKKRNSTDSAFLENISMPSSHSLANLDTNDNNNKSLIKSKSQHANFTNTSNTSTNSSVIGEISPSSQKSNEVVLMEKSLSPTQIAEAQKAEMIRVALEKLKEANIKKLIVKAYTDDGCTKSVIIDETMKSYDVMLLLFNKNHTKPSVKYSIVEYLPKFHMERIFEDHENIVEAMSNWSRDSENQIIFTEKEAKYDLFIRPEFYLLSDSTNKLDENHRNKILNEFFQNIGSSVPEIEGPLYIKVESKKSWKKYYCVLRQSGLYYIPKGKNKKDLQCLFNFDKLDLYFGIDWRKKFKAPTDSCFALKLPQVQKKSSKYIKYLCCENDQDMKRWFNGIRIAKFGKQLYENYKKILELIEMNKVSGRLPMASSRRLSASINNKNQRPRSSYSLLNGEEPNSNIKETNDSSSIKQNNLEDQNVKIDNNTSLLSKQQPTENKSNEESSTKEIKKLIDETYKQKQINLSYTEQLKSLLEAHQSFNQKSISNNESPEHINTSILNNNISNKSWTSPISVSTNNINNAVQFNQNKNNLSSDCKQMINSNNNNNNIQLDSSSSPSSLSPNSQQLFLSSPNLTDSNDLFKRPKQLDLNSKIPILKMNTNQPISPTSSNKSEIKIDINGFIKEPECVYDLPTPPMEIFNTSPKINAFEVTNKQISLPSPTQSSMVQSQIIVQLADNRNSKCVPQPQQQQQSQPYIAPKPVFKRFNSFTNETPDEQFDKIKNFKVYENKERKSINNNNNNNNTNHSRGSSLSRTSSLFQQQQQQQNESCNELAAILARQKKKIEAQIGDSDTIINHNPNTIKIASPNMNISRKPPPPPRNDRSQSQSFTRKMSSEY